MEYPTVYIACRVCGARRDLTPAQAMNHDYPTRTCGSSRCRGILAVAEGRGRDCPACGRPGAAPPQNRGGRYSNLCVACHVVIVKSCVRKFRFGSEEQATEWAARELGEPRRAYDCRICDGSHLTSGDAKPPSGELAAVQAMVLNRIGAGLYALPSGPRTPTSA